MTDYLQQAYAAGVEAALEKLGGTGSDVLTGLAGAYNPVLGGIVGGATADGDNPWSTGLDSWAGGVGTTLASTGLTRALLRKPGEARRFIMDNRLSYKALRGVGTVAGKRLGENHHHPKHHRK